MGIGMHRGKPAGWLGKPGQPGSPASRGKPGHPGRRLAAQFGFFLLQNPFINNFASGRIYQGGLKSACTPGLNCYSCPAAAVSCPIGATQLFLAGARQSISLYATGFLLAVGAVFGRFICGFVCPMGLAQDLLYRIKAPKLVVRLRVLRYAKYAVLALFVVVLPSIARDGLSGLGKPWFCQYICPSGTLFGAVPLLAANDFLRQSAGALFALKISILAGAVALSAIVFRPFCRVLCPLGAVYALLNRVSLLHMRCDKAKCVSCGACSKACHAKIDPVAQPNAPECVRCGKCVSACPHKALSYGMGGTGGARGAGSAGGARGARAADAQL